MSPVLFEPIGEKFRRAIRGWAQASGIPVIVFKAGERKAEVMAPYLQAAAVAGRSPVVAIGCAQEFQLVWTARKRATDPGTVQVWFERWMAWIPLPLTGADRDAGYWREPSMRQIETSRTLVFDDDVHARAFFEALPRENMDLGRPENAGLLFRRGQRRGRPAIPPARGFRKAIDQHCDMVTLNVFYKNSRARQYLKDGIALRIETVVNSPDDLGCNRMLAILPQLQARAHAINDRPLHTEPPARTRHL